MRGSAGATPGPGESQGSLRVPRWSASNRQVPAGDPAEPYVGRLQQTAGPGSPSSATALSARRGNSGKRLLDLASRRLFVQVERHAPAVSRLLPETASHA